MLIDPAAYLAHVDGLDMSEDRKLELIRVVAAIMQSFVDRAFGDAPEQTLLGISTDQATLAGLDRLDSGQLTTTSIFNDAAHEDAARKSIP